jgi:hypothetical protein
MSPGKQRYSLTDSINKVEAGVRDSEWKSFFLICSKILGDGGNQHAFQSTTWCSWTTFNRLKIDAGYWQAGLPTSAELGEEATADGGVWGQPFLYCDIAHVLVPREFYWEHISQGRFDSGSKQQDIDGLSAALTSSGVGHRRTDLVLEIKLY